MDGSAEREARRAERRRGRATVLVVDDESSTVTSVRHLLRRRYEVLGATRAREALALLDDPGVGDVAAVLCDQRMPEMTGDQFFREVLARHPRVVRILMTAYGNLETLADSINHGQIFAYLAKPFTAEQLERVVETAVSYRQLVDANERMTADLQKANDLLVSKNAELQAYTHVVAHDLKEPLRTIAAYARFMDEECGARLGPEGNRFLGGITRCAEHMGRLVDDLLQFSRLDRDDLSVQLVELMSVIEAASEVVAGAVEAGGIRLTLPESAPVVVGDPDRLVLVLQNLLSNACKFRAADHPQVTVFARRAGDKVEFGVADNGIGIPPEHHERIFHIFERLHGRADYPGTGAGLAIVRKIVELHGGSVRVESARGEGTTFTVTLPVPTDG